jgi:galactonate dehydratase
MQIRSVKTYVIEPTETLPKGFIFCRVETDDGTIGWGEAYAIPRRERGIAEYVKGLGGMLITLGDVSPESFRKNVTGWYDEGHLSIDMSSAASALDVALWDIRGKQAGKPLCDLLGDVVRRSFPIYANMDPLSPGESIECLVGHCTAAMQRGFNAVKIYPMEYSPLEQATECVRRVREAIGADTRLLLDIWALDDAQDALDAAEAFAPFNPFWFEEPIAGERHDEMAEIRRRIDMPVVTGERQMGMHHFRAVLDKQAADILNPEIVGVGGIQDIIEIARLAESYDIPVAPHNWNSTIVATAAMVHTSAVVSNALIGEYFYKFEPFFSAIGRLDMDISDSVVTIGDAPGLGVHMDEDALARYAF